MLPQLFATPQTPALVVVDIDRETLAPGGSIADEGRQPCYLGNSVGGACMRWSLHQSGPTVGRTERQETTMTTFTLFSTRTHVEGTAGADNFDFSGFKSTAVDYDSNGGNDVVTGTKFSDTFHLNSGRETINGGPGGSDTVDYSDSHGGVTVNLNQQIQHGGWAEGDKLTNIDNVTADNTFNNTLIGNANDNKLMGGDGNDTLIGGAGKDTLIANSGDHDVLIGGTGVTNAFGVVLGDLTSDTFQFTAEVDVEGVFPGHSTVRDFEVGIDKLHFVGSLESTSDLHMSQHGLDVVLDFEVEEFAGSVTLEHTSLASVQQHLSDFLFS
jgi:hypothetical protein